MAHTVLVVPVPALEGYIRGRWEHYDAAWVSRDPAFTHAHITALAPFRPSPTEEDLARVAAIARTAPAVEFVLDEVRAFPDGIVHLVPSPQAPFAALTARLWEAFPDCPPYAGEFADVVPHLTLDRLGPDVSIATVTADLAGTLPVRARADRLELHRYAERGCRVLATWSLAGIGDPVAQPGRGAGR